MNNYEKALKVMDELFGEDVAMSLTTCIDNTCILKITPFINDIV